MSELAKFDFGNSTLRVENDAGRLWFCAADVCEAIDVTTEQVRRLDDDEKGLRSTQTPGGVQKLTWVNEPGLYSLVLGSRKPEAKAFKRWVTHEVLPALRKTGTYSTKRARRPRIASPDDERRKTLHALAGLVDKAQDGALRDLLRTAAARTVDLLVPSPAMGVAGDDTSAPDGDDLGWQSADFVARATGINATLVGRIGTHIGLRDPRFDAAGLVRLGRQELAEYQKDVPLWQYRGPALRLLISACQAYAAGEFNSLNELAESQRFNAFKVLSVAPV